LLHDTIATHKHHFSSPCKEAKVSASGFICDCGNFVAQSAFLDFEDPISINPEFKFFDYSSRYFNSFQRISIQSFRLRGPPSFDLTSINS
jgi:hypothetical protein